MRIAWEQPIRARSSIHAAYRQFNRQCDRNRRCVGVRRSIGSPQPRMRLPAHCARPTRLYRYKDRCGGKLFGSSQLPGPSIAARERNGSLELQNRIRVKRRSEHLRPLSLGPCRAICMKGLDKSIRLHTLRLPQTSILQKSYVQ